MKFLICWRGSHFSATVSRSVVVLSLIARLALFMHSFVHHSCAAGSHLIVRVCTTPSAATAIAFARRHSTGTHHGANISRPLQHQRGQPTTCAYSTPCPRSTCTQTWVSRQASRPLLSGYVTLDIMACYVPRRCKRCVRDCCIDMVLCTGPS